MHEVKCQANDLKQTESGGCIPELFSDVVDHFTVFENFDHF
jgi:hypothetical protein